MDQMTLFSNNNDNSSRIEFVNGAIEQIKIISDFIYEHRNRDKGGVRRQGSDFITSKIYDLINKEHIKLLKELKNLQGIQG